VLILARVEHFDKDRDVDRTLLRSYIILWVIYCISSPAQFLPMLQLVRCSNRRSHRVFGCIFDILWWWRQQLLIAMHVAGFHFTRLALLFLQFDQVLKFGDREAGHVSQCKDIFGEIFISLFPLMCFVGFVACFLLPPSTGDWPVRHYSSFGSDLWNVSTVLPLIVTLMRQHLHGSTVCSVFRWQHITADS